LSLARARLSNLLVLRLLLQSPTPSTLLPYTTLFRSTYQLQYPAPGHPQLAQQVARLLTQQGITTEIDSQRGFDHGMFIPLKLMFPKANIPVVQLALHNSLDAEMHTTIGKAMASLRDEGVLLIGSGMRFHNMQGYGNSRFRPISEEFDAWLTTAVESPAEERTALLNRWFTAPQARQCHPAGKEEHLIPLHVAAGAAYADVGQRIFSDCVLATTISAYRFG